MRNICYVLAIILLFPFVAGVFINGDQILTSTRNEDMDWVWVETDTDTIQMEYETYLNGVCAQELWNIVEFIKLEKASKPLSMEFLKVQAVIARTNVWKNASYNKKRGWTYREPFWDPVKVGNYYSKDEYEKIAKAMEETRDQIVCVQKKPIQACYFLESNGKTRNGTEIFGDKQFSYLSSVVCENDKKSQRIQEVKLTYQDLAKKCQIEKPSISSKIRWKDLKIISRDKEDYVVQIQVENAVMSGEQFCQLCKLPSASFIIQDYYGKLRILSKGVGHGLGVSQKEANEMAKNGKNYLEILNYFYQNISIESTQDIFKEIE